jgi:hypothetical protein
MARTSKALFARMLLLAAVYPPALAEDIRVKQPRAWSLGIPAQISTTSLRGG